MSESQKRAYFKDHLMFRVYSYRRIWLVMVLIPIGIFALGAVLAFALSVLPDFVGNPLLAVGSPLLVFVGFVTYYWFSIRFPETIAMLSDTFEDHVKFDTVVTKWERRSRGVQFSGLWLFGSVIGIVIGWSSVIAIWRDSSSNPIWASWINSPQPGFFELYYGLCNAVIMPILLAYGLVALFGTIVVICQLLQIPLKLSYHRRLQYITDLCLGIASWTFLAVSIILIIGIQSNPTSIASAIFLSVIGSFALLAIFLIPIIFGRSALVRAKRQKLAGYEAALFEISRQIDVKLLERPQSKKAEGAGTSPEATAADEDKELDSLLKRRQEIIAEIEKVEAIHDFSITKVGAVQIVISVLTPTAGALGNIAIQSLFKNQ